MMFGLGLKVIIILLWAMLVAVEGNQPEVVQISLDTPAMERYTQLAILKKDSIVAFMDHLQSSQLKYWLSFKVIRIIELALPQQWLRGRVGEQFYDECVSVARGISRSVGDVIVFNYMYELGAASDFCTAISVNNQGNGQSYLGRNLDYGYQEYLISNSLKLQYTRDEVLQFQVMGHAGLIGAHTSLRFGKDGSLQYGVVLNQREVGGLHLTLQKILESPCETAPYNLMKLLKRAPLTLDKAVQLLIQSDTCAAVYYLINTQHGSTVLIQKNRGRGAHLIKTQVPDQLAVMVKTNSDEGEPDPDGRRVAAEGKVKASIQGGGFSREVVWQILSQPPNFNQLTLMTAMIDPRNGTLLSQIWPRNMAIQ